ncbi:MAG: response regulator transcription factor [Flavobacterium sp.]|nr:MAG: response regulator transcription factor [Flavobacterium sp.]
MKIAIVEDHQMVRRALCALVATFEGMSVICEAKNGCDFFQKIKEIPDVVLLDIQMPVMNGFETCKAITDKYPEIKVLMLSQLSDKETIFQVVKCGAHGFFTKNSDPDELQCALRKVTDNGFYFANDLALVLRDVVLWNNRQLESYYGSIVLTNREIEVLCLAAQEFSSAEIAEKLFINVRTVETHRKRIMEKTGARNFLGAVIFAVRRNYISLDSF